MSAVGQERTSEPEIEVSFFCVSGAYPSRAGIFVRDFDQLIKIG